MLLKPQQDKKFRVFSHIKGSHKIKSMSHKSSQSIGPLGSLRTFFLIRKDVT